MIGSGPAILIAINAHSAHAPQSILECCRTVRRAADRLLEDMRDCKPRCCLYIEDLAALDPVLFEHLADLGIAVASCAGASNGERLNRQLEDSIRAGDDLFFRVDGDDTVSEQRFTRQVALFLGGSADILGGGLRYQPVGKSSSYSVIPRNQPRAIDYVFNRFMLHPTLGFRVATFERTGLRYWNRRLEDKELILRATTLGLTLRNDPAIYGDYFVHHKARNTPDMAALARDLTVEYLQVTGHKALIPLAYAVWAARRLLPVPFLRRLRSRLFPAKGGA